MTLTATFPEYVNGLYRAEVWVWLLLTKIPVETSVLDMRRPEVTLKVPYGRYEAGIQPFISL